MTFYFFIIFLLAYTLDKVKCDNNISLFTITNYTLSTFRNANFNCSSLEECNFLTIWCKDDVNDKCININMDYYDSYNEKLLNKELKTEPKPILTTCNIESVDNRKCKTPKCQQNNDCFSGLCYKNKCVVNKDIYYCENSMNHIYCQKLNYMSCKEDNECLSSICINETCQPEDYNNANLKDNIELGIFIAFLFLMVLLLQLYFNHLEKKKKVIKKKKN